MCYYTNCGPEKGAVNRNDVPGSIGVLAAPEEPMPIGTAHCTGWTDDGTGTGLWRLIVGVTELPGAWIIRDREFIPMMT
jgi:hypothetical protein